MIVLSLKFTSCAFQRDPFHTIYLISSTLCIDPISLFDLENLENSCLKNLEVLWNSTSATMILRISMV